MNMHFLVVLSLCAITLSGCVVAGGVNYHFPATTRPTDKCDPAAKTCPPATDRDRARP
jgi:hypothetical protein